MLKTIKDVAMEVALYDGFSTDVFDVVCRLEAAENPDNKALSTDIVANYIEGYLESLVDYHERRDNPEKFAEELFKQDFDELRDDAMEWADGCLEVTTWKIWRNAPIIKEYIEEAMAEYGNAEYIIKQDRGIEALFTQGECYFWETFAREVLGVIEELKEYYDEELEAMEEEAAEAADAIDLKIDHEKETKRLGQTD